MMIDIPAQPGEGPAVLPTPDVDTQPAQPDEGPIDFPTPSLPTQPINPIRRCPFGYTSGIVQNGQTFTDLLLRHNVSYQAMRSANPRLSPGYLVVGQSYCAPPAGTRQICQNLQSYTILRGEDLEILAAKLRITKGRLLSLNPNLLPSDFVEGTVICVP